MQLRPCRVVWAIFWAWLGERVQPPRGGQAKEGELAFPCRYRVRVADRNPGTARNALLVAHLSGVGESTALSVVHGWFRSYTWCPVPNV